MIITPGATSQSVTVQIVDDAGLAVTGLVAATFPTTSYERVIEALVGITLSDLAALTSAYSSGGVKEVGGGYYRLDVPDAAFATASRVRIVGEASGKHILYPVITCQKLAGTLGSGDYSGNTVQTGDAFARLGAPAGASLSADVAAVKGDTGNLVTRITSTLFAGITSLAQWLGLIAGSQTGNATARTEVRATGAGSGAYDETLDSLQALRTHGDSAWQTATGFSTLTAAQVRDVDNSAPAGGSLGAKVNSAASAGDPMSATVPGSYSAGQAGYVIGHNLDAAVSSRNAVAPPSAAAIRAEIDANSVTLELIEGHAAAADAASAALPSAATILAVFKGDADWKTMLANVNGVFAFNPDTGVLTLKDKANSVLLATLTLSKDGSGNITARASA